ncbi:MAG: type II toxin-antitoxin system RelE family toxin [Elusimicrobiota bacterium]
MWLEVKTKQYVYPQLKKQLHFGPNIKKLRTWNPETWRYRVGDWRIFYEINLQKKIVYMIALYARKSAY